MQWQAADAVPSMMGAIATGTKERHKTCSHSKTRAMYCTWAVSHSKTRAMYCTWAVLHRYDMLATLIVTGLKDRILSYRSSILSLQTVVCQPIDG
jgi:hypothetical protein